MKKILLILSVHFLFCSIIFSQAGWNTLYTSTNVYFQSNYFVDVNTGFAVGGKFLQRPIVMKTTNAGINWMEQITPQSDSSNIFYRWVFFTNANTGFIAAAHTTNQDYGRILRTSNGGSNWYNVPLEVSQHMTTVYFINSNTGYACGRQTMLKTTNAGISWVLQPTGYQYIFFAIQFPDDNTGYVVGNSGIILKTTNGGTNWFTSLLNAGQYLYGLYFADVNTGIAVGGNPNNTANRILRTTDAGITWSVIPYSNSQCLLWSVNFVNQSTGWIIGWCGQIIKTTNGGENWYKQGTFTNQLRTASFINANTGYIAGENNGVILKTTNGGEPVVNIEPVMNEIPVRYKLYQNYPNPFNPVTKIKFDIPAGEVSPEGLGLRVSIIVYNTLGKEMAVLLDALLDPGSHEVGWNATEYPSGVYFYKLTAGDASVPLTSAEREGSTRFTGTKKMILMK
jgi:photosystem II stability/assembly factor-like uncharacterized protein